MKITRAQLKEIILQEFADRSAPILNPVTTLNDYETKIFDNYVNAVTANLTQLEKVLREDETLDRKDFVYFKNGADSTQGQYDSLFFKDDGGVEHEIDPSLGLSSLIRTNAQTVNEDITISSTTNGMTAGPITIASTKTVTVSGNWSIV